MDFDMPFVADSAAICCDLVFHANKICIGESQKLATVDPPFFCAYLAATIGTRTKEFVCGINTEKNAQVQLRSSNNKPMLVHEEFIYAPNGATLIRVTQKDGMGEVCLVDGFPFIVEQHNIDHQHDHTIDHQYNP
jgi:hypothetical protein